VRHCRAIRREGCRCCRADGIRGRRRRSLLRWDALGAREAGVARHAFHGAAAEAAVQRYPDLISTTSVFVGYTTARRPSGTGCRDVADAQYVKGAGDASGAALYGARFRRLACAATSQLLVDRSLLLRNGHSLGKPLLVTRTSSRGRAHAARHAGSGMLATDRSGVASPMCDVRHRGDDRTDQMRYGKSRAERYPRIHI